jgi:hypothetical protein
MGRWDVIYVSSHVTEHPELLDCEFQTKQFRNEFDKYFINGYGEMYEMDYELELVDNDNRGGLFESKMIPVNNKRKQVKYTGTIDAVTVVDKHLITVKMVMDNGKLKSFLIINKQKLKL